MARIPIPYSATVGSVVPSGPQAVAMPSPAAQFAPHLQQATDIMAREIDNADAMMVTKAKGELETATTETQNAYRALEGSDAFDLSKYDRDWKQKAQEIRDNLKTAAQRDAYDRIANGIYPHLAGDMDAHTARQRDVFDAATTKATSEAGAKAIVTNRTNFDTVAAYVDSIKNTWGSFAARSPKDAPLAEVHAADEISKAHIDALDALVETDVPAAQAYYERFKDQIDPSARTKIAGVLHAGNIKDWSLATYREIAARNPGDFAKQREEASKAAGDDALKYDAIMGRVDQEEVRRNKEEKDTQDALLENVLDRADKTNALDQTDKNYQLLTPGNQLKARRYVQQLGAEARRESAESRRQAAEDRRAAHEEAQSQLADMVLNLSDDEIASMNVRTTFAGAPAPIQLQAVTQQRAAKERIAKRNTDEGVNESKFLDDVKGDAKSLKYNPGTAAQFVLYLEQKYRSFKETNKRPPTPTEAADMRQIAVAEGDAAGGGFWSYLSSNKRQWQVQPGDTFKPFSEQSYIVPGSRADKTTAPSPDQIRPDGTLKGSGFLGSLQRPDGGTSSELSIETGDVVDGKDVLIPTMVPTLTKTEVNLLLSKDPKWVISDDPAARRIVQKAEAFARERYKQGKPFFAAPGESPSTMQASRPTETRESVIARFKAATGRMPTEAQIAAGLRAAGAQ